VISADEDEWSASFQDGTKHRRTSCAKQICLYDFRFLSARYTFRADVESGRQ